MLLHHLLRIAISFCTHAEICSFACIHMQNDGVTQAISSARPEAVEERLNVLRVLDEPQQTYTHIYNYMTNI
jgi:hypothetical protein